MKSRRELEREYDDIAASRMRLHNGGVTHDVALGNKDLLTLMWKIERCGLSIERDLPKFHKLLQNLAVQETLQNQPLGVRYATINRPVNEHKIWGD